MSIIHITEVMLDNVDVKGNSVAVDWPNTKMHLACNFAQVQNYKQVRIECAGTRPTHPIPLLNSSSNMPEDTFD